MKIQRDSWTCSSTLSTRIALKSTKGIGQVSNATFHASKCMHKSSVRTHNRIFSGFSPMLDTRRIAENRSKQAEWPAEWVVWTRSWELVPFSCLHCTWNEKLLPPNSWLMPPTSSCRCDARAYLHAHCYCSVYNCDGKAVSRSTYQNHRKASAEASSQESEVSVLQTSGGQRGETTETVEYPCSEEGKSVFLLKD